MKKILLLVILTFTLSTFGQKNKGKTKAKIESSKSLAKVDNLSMEFLKTDLVISIDNKTAVKDTILLSKLLNKANVSDCKIQAFLANKTPLYVVSWIEKSKVESRLITENIVSTNSIIINLTNKAKVLNNKQTATNIKQINYLDAKQTVSETIEKNRNEGYIFSLLPDGDVVKKSKTKEIRLSYNPTENLYSEFKKKK